MTPCLRRRADAIALEQISSHRPPPTHRAVAVPTVHGYYPAVIRSAEHPRLEPDDRHDDTPPLDPLDTHEAAPSPQRAQDDSAARLHARTRAVRRFEREATPDPYPPGFDPDRARAVWQNIGRLRGTPIRRRTFAEHRPGEPLPAWVGVAALGTLAIGAITAVWISTADHRPAAAARAQTERVAVSERQEARAKLAALGVAPVSLTGQSQNSPTPASTASAVHVSAPSASNETPVVDTTRKEATPGRQAVEPGRPAVEPGRPAVEPQHRAIAVAAARPVTMPEPPAVMAAANTIARRLLPSPQTTAPSAPAVRASATMFSNEGLAIAAQGTSVPSSTPTRPAAPTAHAALDSRTDAAAAHAALDSRTDAAAAHAALDSRTDAAHAALDSHADATAGKVPAVRGRGTVATLPQPSHRNRDLDNAQALQAPKLPVSPRDRAPIGPIGASGIHLDRLTMATQARSGGCALPTSEFVAGRDAYATICFRIVHPRRSERVTVLWERNGNVERRARINVPDTHAHNTRARLRLWKTTTPGSWTVRIVSEDNVELAMRTFEIQAAARDD